MEREESILGSNQINQKLYYKKIHWLLWPWLTSRLKCSSFSVHKNFFITIFLVFEFQTANLMVTATAGAFIYWHLSNCAYLKPAHKLLTSEKGNLLSSVSTQPNHKLAFNIACALQNCTFSVEHTPRRVSAAKVFFHFSIMQFLTSFLNPKRKRNKRHHFSLHITEQNKKNRREQKRGWRGKKNKNNKSIGI